MFCWKHIVLGIFLCLPLLSPPAPLMTGKEQCLHLSHLQRLLSNQGAAQSRERIAFGWVVQPPACSICFDPSFNCQCCSIFPGTAAFSPTVISSGSNTCEMYQCTSALALWTWENNVLAGSFQKLLFLPPPFPVSCLGYLSFRSDCHFLVSSQ